MWLITLFDLPMLTAVQRRTYGRFRKMLLKLGFEAMQKSVYLRWLSSDDSAETVRREILRHAPTDGMVTILPLTHRTLSLASVTIDGVVQQPRSKPDEILVF